jgi:phosphatidate phosphatase APP1
MPALYANLSASLNHPPFAFVTGSPFQLVQFLRGFLRTTYAAAPGPILARNLTLTDTGELDRFLFDVNSTETFKLTQIARIHALWPNKAFLTIGDSGERDPETYGVACVSS